MTGMTNLGIPIPALNANSAIDKRQVVDAFNKKMAGGTIAPPCASLLALEFGYDQISMKARWPGYALFPARFKLVNQVASK